MDSLTTFFKLNSITSQQLDGEKLRGPITPVGNFVLVQNKDTLAATAGGILLPDQVGLKSQMYSFQTPF